VYALAALVVTQVHAQTYPAKPIRLIGPFTAGRGTDISARIVGQKLAERLNTSIVVDNRTGAGGQTASSEQGSRLRDVNVRESDDMPSNRA
jgi:tripartite-type tricarboxylate transporter receptor subunit TctC